MPSPNSQNKLVSLIFGDCQAVSKWLIAIGLLLYIAHVGSSILILLAFGGGSEMLALLPEILLLDPLEHRPHAFILIIAGLVGTRLVTRAEDDELHTGRLKQLPSQRGRQCHRVREIFGISYQLPVWMLLPGIAWAVQLSKAIAQAYESDLPIGVRAWIGPRPHINNFWEDIFWSCVDLSFTTLEFWCFILGLLSAILISACHRGWPLKYRAGVTIAIVTLAALVLGTATAFAPKPWLEKSIAQNAAPPSQKDLQQQAKVVALLHAIEAKSHDEIAKLLKAGADANGRDKRRKTPLEVAIDQKDLKTVRLLLLNGADLSNETSTQTTMLIHSIFFGNREIVDTLIQAGADVEKKDKFDMSPLHPAARAKPYEVVELLIGAGARLDARDQEGRTPLHHAAEMHRLDITKLLLENGADIDAEDQKGRTPLISAVCAFVRSDDRERIDRANAFAELLIEEGADVSAADDRGITALHCAAQFGHLSLVESLLEAGANLAAESNGGRTPLDLAKEMDRAAIEEFLKPIGNR